MPLQKLEFRPGINKEITTLAGKGSWFDGDKIRFRFGLPEKIGGWEVLSYNTFLGACRSLLNWVTLRGYNILGMGTSKKFYLENGTIYYDITPVRSVSAAGAITFVATNGSATILINQIGHGAGNGDYVTFSGVTAGGLGGNITQAVLQQQYEVTYLDGNQYTIQARAVSSITTPGAAVLANASDTGNGGSSVVGTYQIHTGEAIQGAATGWGAGLWGGLVENTPTDQLNGAIDAVVTTIVVDDTTGFPTTGRLLIGTELITYAGKTSTDFTGCVRGVLGTTASSHLDNAIVEDASDYIGWSESATATVAVTLRLWNQATFGESLLINPRGGAIYLWVPGVNAVPDFNLPAKLISSSSTGIYQTDVNCPSKCNILLVSDASRFLIALGVNGYQTDPDPSVLDPMLVRWSDQESYADWTPAATNQAGSFRLSRGSEIISAAQTRQEILIWTDSALYSMQYLGPPFVWGFNILSDNISIISPNASASAGGMTFWMGIDKFYVYSGRVETLPCSLRQYVFTDLNRGQQNQFFAGTNEGFNEIWWFYCSANSDVNDRYVIFNYIDRVWSAGTMGRTAWLDTSLRNFPVAATSTQLLVSHEVGADNGETNPPTPINSYIQSADFDIGTGDRYGFVWRIVPDVTFNNSTSVAPQFPSVEMMLMPRTNPGSDYGAVVPQEVESTQDYKNVRSYSVQQFTQQIYTRERGRQMAFRVESNSLGTQWQLGVSRMDIRPDGRR